MKNRIFGGYRWQVVAVLFLATAIKYIDRNVLSFTMIDESFRRELLGLPIDEPLTSALINSFKIKMGYVDASFKAAYALGFVIMGYLMDRLRVRKGYSLAIGLWSLAALATAFVGNFRSLSIARFGFGFGESANFPAAIKTIAEWFPKKERGLATGIYNAGANMGILATVFLVPFMISNFGWKASFLMTGFLGLILLTLWRWVYYEPNQHPYIRQEELDHIHSDQDMAAKRTLRWREFIKHRGAWAVAIGKFLTDPIWWFYLTWLPDFFNSNEALDTKLELTGLALPFIVIYLSSDIGSIFFGWLSGKFLAMGWSVNKSRKTTLLICALLVIPLMLAALTSNIYIAIPLVALAAAAHQGWSATILTLSSDIFPKAVVGSVVGIAGMVGAIGGTIFAALAGWIIVIYGYFPLFVFASSAYLLAFLAVHLLVPTIQRQKG
ncbi:hexuronate transporter [Echinicola pacifica]|uniref:Hexuronate transporter n=1 Tax=Echinicola pacifica TaxID=346377 RepID=A0A918PN83_9BACT|nr:MFS transporter [Echinicola pacifica]GGZ15882.1 hexuronate transporter [Echinicola pacifica]